MEQEDRKVGRFEDGTEGVIGALIEVHRTLGPGLLESAYEACLCVELALRGLRFCRQEVLPHRHHVPHYWILDPTEETLLVHRWGPDGYIEVLAAERNERVRAEPFEALELRVGVLFGDEDEETHATG